MDAVTRNRVLLGWALVGVPLLFALFVFISYRISLNRSNLPFLGDHEWRYWVAWGTALGSGVVCTYVASSNRTSIRSIAALSYFLVMGLSLVFVGGFVACSRATAYEWLDKRTSTIAHACLCMCLRGGRLGSRATPGARRLFISVGYIYTPQW
jgi:hypothetical protein